MNYLLSSRFRNSSEENGIVLENADILNLPFYEFIVKESQRNRLDLVAYEVYNNPLLWWLIARFNGIFDVSRITPGQSLRIPLISEIL